MKISVRSSIVGVLLGSLPLLGACQSSGGHDEVEATSKRMTELRANIEKAKMEVTATAEALAQVVEKADEDPKPHYDKFTAHAKAVEASYKDAESRLAKARSSADTLFTTWTERNSTITDPDLKERSEERRNDLKETLDEVIKATDAAMAETKSFVSTSNDLKTYLSGDLTPAGIKSIKDKSKSLSKAASSVGEKLDDAMEAAQKASTEFATAKPPPKA